MSTDPLFAPRSDDGSTNVPLPRDNLAQHMVIAAFTGIAWYNVVELNINVYMTFKRRTGLYFWAVILSIQGVLLHSVAFILKLYGIVPQFEITVTMITIGWYLMVTGQSVVLYSRLHLVVNEPRIIRAVLIMICFNAVTLHLPTTVLTYGSNSHDPTPFNDGFNTMEKIQIIIFSIQELIISSIYIWATMRFLRPVYRRNIRSVMLQLLWINVVIIIMDASIVITQFLELYYVEATMKSAIYSVKLKLEFAVLNQLMRLANSSRNGHIISDPQAQTTSSRRGSNAGGAFKTWMRRIFPVPVGSGVDENNFPVEPSVLQSAGSTYHQRQQRMVTSRIKEGRDGHMPPSHGIAMTTEIRQVVSTEGADKDMGVNKAYFIDGHHQRETSLDMVGDGVGSDQSQLELVALPSSSSLDESPSKRPHVHETQVRSPDGTGWPARRLAGPTVSFTKSETGVNNGTYISSATSPQSRSLENRPSLGNLRSQHSRSSRTSSERGLRNDSVS